MKQFLPVVILLLSLDASGQLNRDSLDAANAKAVSADPGFIQKAYISTDSTIWLIANMRKDHRFFGYEKANTNSTKLILFSIFTNDVAGNPYQLQYGAFYQTSGMENRLLKYVSTEGKFIQAHLLDEKTGSVISEMYFDRKWFEFDKR